MITRRGHSSFPLPLLLSSWGLNYWLVSLCTCWLYNFSQLHKNIYSNTYINPVALALNIHSIFFTATTKGLWAATTLCLHADRQCTTISSRLLQWDSFWDSPCWCVNTAVTWVHVAMCFFYSSTCSMFLVANEPDKQGLSCTYNCTMSGSYQNLSTNLGNF